MPFLLAQHSDLDVCALARQLESSTLEEVLIWAWERFGAQAAIGTSYQASGLVIIHHARRLGLEFPVFTVDTGLLFPETVALKERLENFFGIAIEVLQPGETVDEQCQRWGCDLWSVDPDRCCALRRVHPIQARLARLDLWITGLRRNQSPSRKSLGVLELYAFDKQHSRYLFKLNPTAHWSRQAVWDYIHAHHIPYNSLHDRGYRSIGCWPCTRIGAGGCDRAGRWEGHDKTECGIHTFLPRKP